MNNINTKYDLGQQVFYYKQGSIWHCRIVEIDITIRGDKTRVTYDIMPYSEQLSNKFCNIDEDNLVIDIQDIINIIPIK